MNVLELLSSAGWDPFDPSEECRKATNLPAMPSWLSEIDRFCIYHNYLTLVFYSRFARGTKDDDPRRGQLMAAAVLFALRRTNLAEGLTPAMAEEWAEKIEQWRQDVFIPANKRMEEADPQDVMTNPRAYEPAVTYSFLTVNLGLVDVERDRELMSLGRAMHEEDSDRPRGRVKTTAADLEAFHAWLTEQGNTIARITEQGKIEIDPLQVKKWYDTKLGRALQPEGEAEIPLHMPDEDQADFVEALASVDQVERIRQIRDARLAEAEEGSPGWHVLHRFFDLAQGDLSFRALSEEVGIPRTTLQDAFAAEREAIVKALKAA